MKKLMIDAAVVAGAMSIAGIMYMKKHPEMIDSMKDSIKEMTRTIYNKLDTED